MKVVIAADKLATALDFVASIVPQRTPMPILGHAKLLVADGKLTVTATDLDIQLAADVDVQDSEPGALTVPCMRLKNLVAALPGTAEITLRLVADRLTVTSGRGRWLLPSLPIEDFPHLTPPDDLVTEFTLTQTEAQRVIKRVEHAIATEETRYYLNGIFLDHPAGKLIAVATDGHRLAHIAVEHDYVEGPIPPVIVPRRTVEVLAKLAREGDVKVRYSNARIEASAAHFTLTSKLVDGTFPDYERVVPAAGDNMVTVESAALAGAIERLVAVSSTKDAPAIGLTWDNASLSLCLAWEPELGSEEIEPVTVNGTGRVAAKAAYLIEQLKALDGEMVVIDHNEPSVPIRITRPDEPTTTTVVMPMRWIASPAVETPATAPPAEQPRRTAKRPRRTAKRTRKKRKEATVRQTTNPTSP